MCFTLVQISIEWCVPSVPGIRGQSFEQALEMKWLDSRLWGEITVTLQGHLSLVWYQLCDNHTHHRKRTQATETRDKAIIQWQIFLVSRPKWKPCTDASVPAVGAPVQSFLGPPVAQPAAEVGTQAWLVDPLLLLFLHCPPLGDFLWAHNRLHHWNSYNSPIHPLSCAPEGGGGRRARRFCRRGTCVTGNFILKTCLIWGFPGGTVVKNPPANAGDTGSSPGQGRSHMPRSTKPMGHNYWACALEPASHNYWAHKPQLLKPVRLEPVLRNKRSHHSEKPAHRNEE